MNYKITIEYEGNRYNGWQRQTSTQNTIQGVLEDAIKAVTGEITEVNGSGRTDAGVNAKGQVANFRLNNKYNNLLNDINASIPGDIRILDCTTVDDRFHARLNAKGKIYEYKIDISQKPSVFTRRCIYHFPCDIDISKMELASKHLIGEMDFMAFCSNKRTKKSTIRTINSIDIKLINNELTITYEGNGFLYNMVRIITGTLLDVGIGKIDPNEVKEILESKDRTKAGKTMPARGLTLLEVKY